MSYVLGQLMFDGTLLNVCFKKSYLYIIRTEIRFIALFIINGRSTEVYKVY